MRHVALVWLTLLAAACGGSPTQPTPAAASVSGVPAAIGDGWTLSSLRDERIDPARIVVRPMNLVVIVIARDDRNDTGRQILDEVLAATA